MELKDLITLKFLKSIKKTKGKVDSRIDELAGKIDNIRIPKDGSCGKDGQPGAKGDKGGKGDAGVKGDKGDVGPAGAPGKDGKDAPRIIDIRIENGDLIAALDDGDEFNAGQVIFSPEIDTSNDKYKKELAECLRLI